MKLSLMRYFAWISLLFMAAVSCRSSRVELSGEQAYKIHASIMDGSFEKVTFKAKVIYRDRELSGLMFIKNSGNGNYKIAFYNELGMTYLEGSFDNSLKRNQLMVKNIAPIINHKSFLKNFGKSLQIVLTEKPITRLRASVPPRLRASIPPENNESSLMVKLCNGFKLDLIPK